MIILLGFPKSGTTSFQKLFSELGYNSYHWRKNNQYIGEMVYKNKINNKPLLNDFLDADVITQLDVCLNEKCSYWPQIEHYKQLYKENPNSIFILNKRNPEKILKSFKNWNNYDERLFNYSPKLIDDKTDEGFINFVNKFYTDIENYFSHYPDAKFITYEIENDKLEKLKKYIDIKNFTHFPKENVKINV
jgi:hypothetical protein